MQLGDYLNSKIIGKYFKFEENGMSLDFTEEGVFLGDGTKESFIPYTQEEKK